MKPTIELDLTVAEIETLRPHLRALGIRRVWISNPTEADYARVTQVEQGSVSQEAVPVDLRFSVELDDELTLGWYVDVVVSSPSEPIHIVDQTIGEILDWLPYEISQDLQTVLHKWIDAVEAECSRRTGALADLVALGEDLQALAGAEASILSGIAGQLRDEVAANHLSHAAGDAAADGRD